jgi:Lipocalin-like domain
MTFLKLASTISIFVFSLSCTKKKDVVPININELLTAGTKKEWLLTNITTNGKVVISDCAKDDVYQFDKNELQATYYPNNKCYSNDDVQVFNYKISESDKKLTIDSVEYQIEEISAKKLVLSHDGNDSPARISQITSTLHQQQTISFVSKN